MPKYKFKYSQKQNDKTVIKTSSFKDEFLKELIRISAPDSKEDCEGERLINCIGRKVLSYVEKNR